MTIHEDQNTRASQMWRIISQHVDFRKRAVIDLGCGHGEMLWRSLLAGADYVCGIDKELKEYAKDLAIAYTDIHLIETDLNVDIDHENPYWLREKNWGIALCFSVLPYLDHPRRALKWMAENFPVVILEVQYEPEPYNIGTANDKQMFSLLRDSGFKIVYQIGRTHVDIHDAWRTIWKCQKVET